MDDLFTRQAQRNAPLADRMRPRNLDEFIGQDHIVGPGRLLRRAIETDSLQSSIFFGPPGCGKTTLAAIVANSTHSAFVKMNAVTAGVKELREVLAEAESQLKLYGRPTYLLLDECHRWSKAQSDALLPALETGVVRFIGSTTENPMIAMTGAIVSRCRLFQFYPLSVEDVKKSMLTALADRERGLGDYHAQVDPEALDHIARIANGDARAALNALREKRIDAAYYDPAELDALSGEDLAQFAREERRRELCLEGHRWFDLRRYRVAAAYPQGITLTHTQTNRAYNEVTYEYETAWVRRFTLTSDDPAWVLPLPEEEIDKNTGMINNPRNERSYENVN